MAPKHIFIRISSIIFLVTTLFINQIIADASNNHLHVISSNHLEDDESSVLRPVGDASNLGAYLNKFSSSYETLQPSSPPMPPEENQSKM